MNDRQRKKNFKKIVGFNPDKGMSKIEIRFVTWALNPKRIRITGRAIAAYKAKRQQVVNVEHFNEVMTERRTRWIREL